MKRLWLAWFVCLVAVPPQAQAQGFLARYDPTTGFNGGSVRVPGIKPGSVVPGEGRGAINCTVTFSCFEGNEFPVWRDDKGKPVLNSLGHPFSFVPHQRHIGVRVEVYDSPNAPTPLKVRSTRLIELPRGQTVDKDGNPVAANDPACAGLYYRDEVHFLIPMPSREKPYVVKAFWYFGAPDPKPYQDQNGSVRIHDNYTRSAGGFRFRVK
jgi:hypothetical protein